MIAQDLPDLEVSDKKLDDMANFLFDELTQCESDRSRLQRLWLNIQKMYEQLDIPEKKDHPFEGAANIMIPVIPTYVEQIHSKIMNTLYTPEDPMACRPTNPAFAQKARGFRRWLTWALEHEVDMENVDSSLFLEMLKLGPTVAKIVYVKEEKTRWKYDESTEKYEKIPETITDNPVIVHVPLMDFFYPLYARKLEQAEWKAHRIRITWNELKRRAAAGKYSKEALEEIRKWYVTQKPEHERETDDLQNIEPMSMVEFELYDVWFQYPIEDKPSEEGLEPAAWDKFGQLNNMALPTDLVGILHKDSKKWLKLQYNWYPLGLDPFEICNYVDREHKVLGLGVGQMALPFQVEVSTMHNQRLDNATVANSVCYVYKDDSTIPADLILRPGKGIPVSDVDADIKPFAIGTKYDSTIAEEQQTLSFLQERVGAKELSLDDATLSRTPATTALAVMQERGRRLDNVIRNIRRFKRRVVGKVLLLYKNFYPLEKIPLIMGEEDGTAVLEMLSLPDTMIWDGIGVEVTATTSSTSRELERQSKLTLFNLLTQYYGQVVQYGMGLANPQIPPQLRAALTQITHGLQIFVGEILEDFDVRDRSEFVVSLENAANAAIASGMGGPPGMAPAGAGAPMGGPAATGAPALPPGGGQGNGRSAGVGVAQG